MPAAVGAATFFWLLGKLFCCMLVCLEEGRYNHSDAKATPKVFEAVFPKLENSGVRFWRIGFRAVRNL